MDLVQVFELAPQGIIASTESQHCAVQATFALEDCPLLKLVLLGPFCRRLVQCPEQTVLTARLASFLPGWVSQLQKHARAARVVCTRLGLEDPLAICVFPARTQSVQECHHVSCAEAAKSKHAPEHLDAWIVYRESSNRPEARVCV